MATHTEDEENPPMNVTKFLFFKNPDPGITQMGISMFTNIVMTHMLMYGLTGRGQLAMGCSLLSVPISAVLSVRDSRHDFDKWKEMQVLKQRGVPDRFLPYRCKYDWTDYNIKMAEKDRIRAMRSSE